MCAVHLIEIHFKLGGTGTNRRLWSFNSTLRRFCLERDAFVLCTIDLNEVNLGSISQSNKCGSQSVARSFFSKVLISDYLLTRTFPISCAWFNTRRTHGSVSFSFSIFLIEYVNWMNDVIEIWPMTGSRKFSFQIYYQLENVRSIPLDSTCDERAAPSVRIRHWLRSNQFDRL